jgi:hypothetical protein
VRGTLTALQHAPYLGVVPGHCHDASVGCHGGRAPSQLHACREAVRRQHRRHRARCRRQHQHAAVGRRDAVHLAVGAQDRRRELLGAAAAAREGNKRDGVVGRVDLEGKGEGGEVRCVLQEHDFRL